MQVSVETTTNLGRKLKVQIPAEEVEKSVASRLQSLTPKVKMDGFRPGKVPASVVKQRYGAGVREEVVGELVRQNLVAALQQESLTPAGPPFIDEITNETEKDLEFTASFEVFPTVEFVELEGVEIEKVSAKLKDSDVDGMIEKLREQHKEWSEVERAAQDGDKLIIDFEGYIDDEKFDGGSANDFELVLGSGSMIPGFEAGLVGVAVDGETELNVTFPADYHQSSLADKPAMFKVTVKKVLTGQLPELDDDLAKKFNIEDGGIEALRKEISENMQRELENQINTLNKEKVFDSFLEKNTIEIPTALIDTEIEQLKSEMMKRVFGGREVDEKDLPDLPRNMFEEKAKRRVHLGLLVSEYIKKHDIKPDAERVDAMLEKIASAYEKPEELIQWYRTNKDRSAEIESIVLEDQVIEKILESVTVVEKIMDYNEVINPSNTTE